MALSVAMTLQDLRPGDFILLPPGIQKDAEGFFDSLVDAAEKPMLSVPRGLARLLWLYDALVVHHLPIPATPDDMVNLMRGYRDVIIKSRTAEPVTQADLPTITALSKILLYLHQCSNSVSYERAMGHYNRHE